METLDDVLKKLSEIIADAKAKNSPHGYFATLYRAMTAEVLRGIQTGDFENAERMERLDVVFAKRYFSALEKWQSGNQAPQSWQAAFQAAENGQVIVLQHLILGIHAHINFDLGIAAAEISRGDEVFQLKNDFQKINEIIARLTDRVQNGLSEIWPPLAIFDRLLRTRDEGFINFSTRIARDAAWQAAQHLAFLNGSARDFYIEKLDGSVAFFAGKILRPGFLIENALPLVRRFEIGSVGETIA